MNKFSVISCFVVTLLAASGVPHAWADKNLQSLPDDLEACVNEEDDALRLECYDREVPKWGSMPPEEIAQQTKEEDFGQPPMEAFDKEELTAISATVTKLRKNAGKVTVWLDNDQVWQQKYNMNLLIKEGDTVSIEKKSLLGGHKLIVRGRNIEVRRVK